MSLSTEFVFSNLVILTTKHLLNIKEAQNIKAVNDSVIKLFNANQNCLAFKETISSVKKRVQFGCKKFSHIVDPTHLLNLAKTNKIRVPKKPAQKTLRIVRENYCKTH